MQPILPFEPVRTEEIPTGDKWVGQVKWDGVRVLVYHQGKQTRLFNRRKNERTRHYPELADIAAYCSARSVILDGEVIAFKNGVPSFYQVMKRDGLRNFSRLSMVASEVPITYMIFDMLYLNGKWITTYPLAERQQLLTELITPNEHIQVVESFADTVALYEAVRKNNLEGVVYKDLTSTYQINGKDQRWRKKKNLHDLIAVVGGVTFSNSIVHSLMLGLYDQAGKLWYIGSAGTGKLSLQDWREITAAANSIAQSEPPFINPPQVSGVMWVKPLLTVKVHYLQWSEGHSLRQPTIEAFVTVPPTSCLLP